MIQDDLRSTTFPIFLLWKILAANIGDHLTAQAALWPAFFHNTPPLVFVASFGYIYIDSSTMADEEETQALVCDNGMSQ